MGKFENGHEKSGGRQTGTPNKLTKTVKETVLQVFNELQEKEETGLKGFAEKYPRDFYAIAAKLIPTEISANVKSVHKLIIVRDTAASIPHSDFTPDAEISDESAQEIQYDLLRPALGENKTE